MDDSKLLEKLLNQSEGPTLDFKSESIRVDNEFYKAEFIKNVICLANTPRKGSAYIVVGVVSKPDGTKKVIGVSTHCDDANLQTLTSSKVKPIPQFHYRVVAYQEKSLGILEVYPKRGGPFLPVSDFKGMLRHNVFYFRRGSSNEEAGAEDIRDIVEWMKTPDGREKYDKKADFRGISIPIGGASLSLPSFFPSISSIKANLEPVDCLQVLQKVDHPLFLISAYDISKCNNNRILKKIEAILTNSVMQHKAVFLDSGTYESFWLRDRTWSAKSFRTYLKSLDYGFAFHFDKREQQSITESVPILINEIERGVLRDQEQATRGTIIPIVHAPTELFPKVTTGVAKRLAPIMIGMPERELGQGIISKAEMIYKIRLGLNETGQYYPIHLLGTGNPLSILVYVICGADSFDGLEWCQSAIDHNTALLYHFQQREFFGPQSEFCSRPELPYIQATLAHNLLFYRKWMEKIKQALQSGEIGVLAQSYLPKPFSEALFEKLPGVFKR